MDGLAAVPKLDDPHIKKHRPGLIPNDTLALREGFALHPNLKMVHEAYQSGDAAIVHAVAGAVARPVPLPRPGSAGERHR